MLWEKQVPVPPRYGHKLPSWAVKHFEGVWRLFARESNVKALGPIEYYYIGDDHAGDRIWLAKRLYGPRRTSRTGVRLALHQEGGHGRRVRVFFDEAHDERKRLDLLASHGTVVVSPLRSHDER